MELNLSIREAWKDMNILLDKLSSLNEKFNLLTTSFSEKSLEKENAFSSVSDLKVKLQNLTTEHEICTKNCTMLLKL